MCEKELIVNCKLFKEQRQNYDKVEILNGLYERLDCMCCNITSGSFAKTNCAQYRCLESLKHFCSERFSTLGLSLDAFPIYLSNNFLSLL